ncbi:1,4-alpha-glucan branching protein GlgB [Anaerosporobacter faecicola]|uniref:1,4-alpha-glucan branching protein GlgB n=1 Tax=Anaerosporobacter faecicola TaxID=2718714 RepID=UPI00143C9AC2|nr:1,4-alpha-glucan branching protein GlgB [Anaerosporobacter faecicola]
MNDTLYNLCDWAEIEAIVYSEHDNPHTILGPHVTNEGILFNTFIPTAVNVVLHMNKSGKEYTMEVADEAGFFAVLVKMKKIPEYTYIVTYDNGDVQTIVDPYQFDPVIDGMDLKLFTSGVHYDIYNRLGAHPMEVGGVPGTLFAVWAPNAMRVSVVGDFNLWDGRRHPMRRLGDSGVFELFIPGLQKGQLYKYEIKVNSECVMLKADPYGYRAELRPATASIIDDLSTYQWKDEEYLKKREKKNYKEEPMSIYEVHLGSFKRPDVEDQDSAFYNYRELATMLATYVKEMGYTHIELMPIMEHPFDESWGYQVTGYYAATARYGSPEDFMYFIDYMHKHNIGVILDWVPAHFPRDAFGLANFDGTCLYEHLDPRQGSHPHWGTLIYNYGRPEVSNFLIANALFWAKMYHIDGIRMDAVASMLYLDYGKEDGGWVANIYGGNENLEAVKFLQDLSTIFKKECKGVLLIAEESTAWEKVTGEVEDGGLGFDLKWNMGWMNDFTNYMKCDPLFRKGRHGELTFSMIYAYSENFVLVLSHDEVVHGKGSMINKMPGSYEQKFANLRVAYGYMMAHPGKKLLFMGQDIAQFDEWNEKSSIQWNLLEYDAHREMKDYVKALNRLYKDYPALYQLDFSSDGFEWINSMDADKSIVSFLRKTEKEEETLLVICNFTPVVYENFKIGVPFDGKYKETFSSDKEQFGGKGYVNPRLKYSKPDECDGRENSITITVPPLGISVFTCTPIALAKTEKKEKASAKTKTGKAETKASKETKTAKSTKTTKATKSIKTGKASKTADTVDTAKTTETVKTAKSSKQTKITSKTKIEKKQETTESPLTEVKKVITRKSAKKVVDPQKIKADDQMQEDKVVKMADQMQEDETVKADQMNKDKAVKAADQIKDVKKANNLEQMTEVTKENENKKRSDAEETKANISAKVKEQKDKVTKLVKKVIKQEVALEPETQPEITTPTGKDFGKKSVIQEEIAVTQESMEKVTRKKRGRPRKQKLQQQAEK